MCSNPDKLKFRSLMPNKEDYSEKYVGIQFLSAYKGDERIVNIDIRNISTLRALRRNYYNLTKRTSLDDSVLDLNSHLKKLRKKKSK